ncbi:hypothetical protein F5Y07DRAFT_409374 [Xylaria sp. FL0933]|nr:hypothetical protein F5Y07DRAFT_409374 [Xylaria sp. FL0933]
MNSHLSMNYSEPNVKAVDSQIDEMSDLIFSFDNDIVMDDSAMGLTSQPPCSSTALRSSSPSSSTSQSGYIMISYPSSGLNTESCSTKSYNSRISPQDHMASKDKNRRTRQVSPTTLLMRELPPSDTVNYPQRLSQSYLQSPLESPYSPTPESTTPRTRQFQDNMLALLSLLPSERYLSPAPSNEEHQFEDEVDMRGYGPGACPTCSGSSAPVTIAVAPRGSHSPYSSSSSSLVEFCDDTSGPGTVAG